MTFWSLWNKAVAKSCYPGPFFSKKQIEAGECKNLRKLLDTVFDEPRTLEDVSLKFTLVEQVNQTLLNLWCRTPTLAAQPRSAEEDSDLVESEPEKMETPVGPFKDTQLN